MQGIKPCSVVILPPSRDLAERALENGGTLVFRGELDAVAVGKLMKSKRKLHVKNNQHGRGVLATNGRGGFALGASEPGHCPAAGVGPVGAAHDAHLSDGHGVLADCDESTDGRFGTTGVPGLAADVGPANLSMTNHAYNEKWLANLRESLYGKIMPLNFKTKSSLNNMQGIKPCSVVILPPSRDLAERALENGGTLVFRGELDAVTVGKLMKSKRKLHVKNNQHGRGVLATNGRGGFALGASEPGHCPAAGVGPVGAAHDAHLSMTTSYNDIWLAKLRQSLKGRIMPLRFKPKSLLPQNRYPTGAKLESDRIEQKMVDLNMHVAHTDQTFKRFKGHQATPRYCRLMLRKKEKMKRKMELDIIFQQFEERKQKCAKMSKREGYVNLDCVDYIYKNMSLMLM